MGTVKNYRIDLPTGYPFATCPKCQEPVKQGEEYVYLEEHWWHKRHAPKEVSGG